MNIAAHIRSLFGESCRRELGSKLVLATRTVTATLYVSPDLLPAAIHGLADKCFFVDEQFLVSKMRAVPVLPPSGSQDAIGTVYPPHHWTTFTLSYVAVLTATYGECRPVSKCWMMLGRPGTCEKGVVKLWVKGRFRPMGFCISHITIRQLLIERPRRLEHHY